MKSYRYKSMAIALVGVMVLSATTTSVPVVTAKKAPRLSRKKVTIAVGKSIRLKVKNNHKKVRWSSSQKKIATVSAKGIVRGKRKGTAKIYARVGKKKLVCRVKVVIKATGATHGETPARTEPTGPEVVNENGGQSQENPQTYVQQVYGIVNEERQKAGENSLVLDEKLCVLAQIRGNELIKLMSHTRPDGSNCFSILQEHGIDYRACAENVAFGQSSPKEVMEDWMSSPGHRDNILGSAYGKIGIGCVRTATGTYYWVQIFTD